MHQEIVYLEALLTESVSYDFSAALDTNLFYFFPSFPRLGCSDVVLPISQMKEL